MFVEKTMRRRILASLVVVAILTMTHLAASQPANKTARLGWLMVNYSARSDSFRQGLKEFGYEEGRNLKLEIRNVDGKVDRLAQLAAELVQLKVDVIVALEPPAMLAARDATKTIPIVMRSTDDPVEAGFVASLARPGGNITGVTSISSELYGKRLELLKETMPAISRVAVLWNPGFPAGAVNFKEMEAAAKPLGLQLQSVEARRQDDFAGALRAAIGKHAQGLITLRNPLIVADRKRIADLATKHRLPAIYDDRDFVEIGGLMSYGANLTDLYHRAAMYVDKILKGAKPADLPVEQPTKFEFVINLKAAKLIGVTIPPNVLARADKVIK
jgi:putative ABC transport system substrate-binding protein